MWTIVISLIFYFSFIKRRWYNGQHSCLPSSWSGFDSRPTQLFSSAHIYWEKRGSPVVYWSRRLTSVRKLGGSNPVLGECFWANDLNKWSGTHYSWQKLWILNLLMSCSEMRCKDLDRQPEFIVIQLTVSGGEWPSLLVRGLSRRKMRNSCYKQTNKQTNSILDTMSSVVGN